MLGTRDWRFCQLVANLQGQLRSGSFYLLHLLDWPAGHGEMKSEGWPLPNGPFKASGQGRERLGLAARPGTLRLAAFAFGAL